MRHFDISEFNCTHTGLNKMDEDFLAKLDGLRTACGFPFTITSGYRDISHPNERSKAVGGTHSQGIAADIAVTGGVQRKKLVEMALAQGFTGVGVGDDFVHVDARKTEPQLWPY